LLSPKNPSDKEFILDQIRTSVSLHRTGKIILSNHTDCGAYGGSSKFASPGEEREFHIKEMNAAKEVILSIFPDVSVKTVLLKLEEEGEMEFEEVS
jgi:hypothetical protein